MLQPTGHLLESLMSTELCGSLTKTHQWFTSVLCGTAFLNTGKTLTEKGSVQKQELMRQL